MAPRIGAGGVGVRGRGLPGVGRQRWAWKRSWDESGLTLGLLLTMGWEERLGVLGILKPSP